MWWIPGIVVILICFVFGTERVVRWPLFVVISLLILCELVLYGVLRLIVLATGVIGKVAKFSNHGLRRLVREGNEHPTFEQWREAAERLDAVDTGSSLPGATGTEADFDSRLILTLTSQLQYELEAVSLASNRNSLLQASSKLAATVRTALCVPNPGSVFSEALFQQSHAGNAASCVTSFFATLTTALETLRRVCTLPVRLAIAHDLSRAFGETALCLSGGGGLGQCNGLRFCSLEALSFATQTAGALSARW